MLTCAGSLYILILDISVPGGRGGWGVRVNMCEYNKLRAILYPIHNSKVHSHFEGGGAKMNTFRKVSEQLMVERLDPESIPTLMIN